MLAVHCRDLRADGESADHLSRVAIRLEPKKLSISIQHTHHSTFVSPCFELSCSGLQYSTSTIAEAAGNGTARPVCTSSHKQMPSIDSMHAGVLLIWSWV